MLEEPLKPGSGSAVAQVLGTGPTAEFDAMPACFAELIHSAREELVVTQGGPHIWAIVNVLADRVGPVSVILETPESKKRLLLGRARRQGKAHALGRAAAEEGAFEPPGHTRPARAPARASANPIS